MTLIRYEVWPSELMELEEGEASDPRHDTIVVVAEIDYLRIEKVLKWLAEGGWDCDPEIIREECNKVFE